MEFQNSRSRRIGMPKAKAIFDYWMARDDFQYDIEERECFACGNCMHTLHRAHILALINGGTNELSNLQLLCAGCHIQSEGIKDYWTWFKFKRKNDWNYPLYYLERHIESQGIDLKKEALYLESINATAEQVNDHIKKLLEKVLVIRGK